MSSLEVSLLLVRHGEAEQNLKESTAIIDFLEDGEKRLKDSELTETGRKQAELVAKRLKLEKIDLAAASDLRRARDTALTVAGQQNNLQVRDISRLCSHWSRSIKTVFALVGS